MALSNTKVLYTETITDPANGSKTKTNVRQLANDNFSDRPANFLIALNSSDKALLLELNDDVVFPVPANNGTLNFDQDDLIRFSNLRVKNESGGNASGSLIITYGWLYKDIVDANVLLATSDKVF